MVSHHKDDPPFTTMRRNCPADPATPAPVDCPEASNQGPALCLMLMRETPGVGGAVGVGGSPADLRG